MAQCLLDTGYIISGCSLSNIGGVREVYAKTFSGGTYTTDSNGQITAMSLSVSGSTWYTFEQRRGNAEFTEELEPSLENRTNVFKQTVTLVFQKRETTTRNILYLLARNDLLLIIRTQNNDYWLVGSYKGAKVISSTGNVGKSLGDGNNIIVTIEARELIPSRKISSTLIGNLTLSN